VCAERNTMHGCARESASHIATHTALRSYWRRPFGRAAAARRRRPLNVIALKSLIEGPSRQSSCKLNVKAVLALGLFTFCAPQDVRLDGYARSSVPASPAVARMGRVKQKVLPRRVLFSTQIRPPCPWTLHLEMNRPSPTPRRSFFSTGRTGQKRLRAFHPECLRLRSASRS
jgi:hypothetical protein